MYATHVKARTNNKKMQNRIAQQKALFYTNMLRKDIDTDRETHGKQQLKESLEQQKKTMDSGIYRCTDKNKGRANLCVHEFKETCKIQ